MSTTSRTPASTTVNAMLHVADLVSEVPSRAVIFEQLGIEYCCGGKVSLIDACASLGLAVDEVVAMLEAAATTTPDEANWSGVTIEHLVTNIIDVHHAYLYETLPRAGQLAHKVARAHGARDPRLVEARDTVDRLIEELDEHMATEERDVFPRCMRVAVGEQVDPAEVGTLLVALEDDHAAVAELLVKLNDLLDGFAPPAGACPTYRSYLDTLQHVEEDIHRHMHKENHVLFGKVRDAAAT